MVRFNDWRARLDEVFSRNRDLDFKYGVNDCSTFAGDAVLAMTGIDIMADYRGRYKTLSGGLNLLKKNGIRDNAELFASYLKEVPIAFAAVGDVGVISTDDGFSICIIAGHFVMAVSPKGLVQVPISNLIRVFKV